MTTNTITMTNEEMFTKIQTYVTYYNEHDCNEDDCDYNEKEAEYEEFSHKLLFTNEFFELDRKTIFTIPFDNGSKIIVELDDDSIYDTRFESYNSNDDFIPDNELIYNIAEMYLNEHYRLIV